MRCEPPESLSRRWPAAARTRRIVTVVDPVITSKPTVLTPEAGPSALPARHGVAHIGSRWAIGAGISPRLPRWPEEPSQPAVERGFGGQRRGSATRSCRPTSPTCRRTGSRAPTRRTPPVTSISRSSMWTSAVRSGCAVVPGPNTPTAWAIPTPATRAPYPMTEVDGAARHRAGVRAPRRRPRRRAWLAAARRGPGALGRGGRAGSGRSSARRTGSPGTPTG